MSTLIVKIFDLWMDKHYPYFYVVYGLIYILLAVIFIASIISTFWNCDWWWKSALLSLVLIFVTHFLMSASLRAKADEFKNKKR